MTPEEEQMVWAVLGEGLERRREVVCWWEDWRKMGQQVPEVDGAVG